MFELIKQLSEARGVSGDEGEVRELIRGLMEPRCDRVWTDRMGNLICYKKGRDGSKRILVDTHMDEVGLIVSYVTGDGLLKFQTVGGVDPRVLIGRKVRVGERIGVISTKAVHLTTEEERKTAPDEQQLFIDIGAQSREEALKEVSLGQTASFFTVCERFGEGLVKGKALDNRIGCAAAIRSAEHIPYYDTYYVFAVQEEVGLRGAYAGAYGIRPDLAVVADVTTAADLPGVPEHRRACRLGEGAVLIFMEGSTLYPSGSYDKLKRCAEKNGIRFQEKELVAGGVDAGAIQRQPGGVEVLTVELACRYLHSPAGVASLADAEEMEKLLCALLADPSLLER